MKKRAATEQASVVSFAPNTSKRETHLNQVEEVGRLGDRVGARAARVAVQQNFLRLLEDRVEELLQADCGVALIAPIATNCSCGRFSQNIRRMKNVFSEF